MQFISIQTAQDTLKYEAQELAHKNAKRSR